MNEQRLKTMPIPKLLVQMSVPMIVAMVVNGLYFLTDAVFVGWSVGPDALAALASGLPVDMMIVALASMIGIGTASIVSYKLGARKKEETAATIRTAIVFSSVLAVVASVVLMLFKTSILTGFGANGRVLEYADSFYTVMMPGYIFVFLSFLGINSVRAEGNAKLAAAAMFSGAVINVLLNAFFILWLHMGTAGSALGTLIARSITVIMLALYYILGKSNVDIRAPGRRINASEIGKIAVFGFGAFTNQVAFSILAAVMNILLKQYGTALDMSVYGVISRIQVFITMPFMGLAQGLQPVIGFNLGAGKLRRVSQAVKISALYSMAIGAFLSVFLLFWPGGVLSLFTNEKEVIFKGAQALQISSIMIPLVGIQILAYFYFMSVHKPVAAILISLVRQVVFIIPILAIFTAFWGYNGIWTAYPLADFITVAVSVITVYASVRKLMKNCSCHVQFPDKADEIPELEA